MITAYPAAARFHAEQDWLRSNFSFSFGPYYDEDNTAFGPMRVLNDDFVAPGRGFGAHPHSDMEVVSIVLQGEMRHQDNLGTVAITSFGEIQLMSAGRGIVHTECNASDTEELNLLQMWFVPTDRGLPPTYHTSRFDVSALHGQWLPVVTSVRDAAGGPVGTAMNPATPGNAVDIGQTATQTVPAVARIYQDMTIYLGRIGAGETLVYEGNRVRRVFLFVIEGSATVGSDVELEQRDALRVYGESRLHIKARQDALLMAIDLP